MCLILQGPAPPPHALSRPQILSFTLPAGLPTLQDALYNFTGLVLGHGGATVQRIQKASGAKVEVRRRGPLSATGLGGSLVHMRL